MSDIQQTIDAANKAVADALTLADAARYAMEFMSKLHDAQDSALFFNIWKDGDWKNMALKFPMFDLDRAGSEVAKKIKQANLHCIIINAEYCYRNLAIEGAGNRSVIDRDLLRRLISALRIAIA